MRTCTNCYSENGQSNIVCFQCGGMLLPVVDEGQNVAESSSGLSIQSSASSRSSSENTAPRNTEVTAHDPDIIKLLHAIERNTQMTERSLAATRSIAIFIVGWIGWLLVGLILILFGGSLSVVPDIQTLGILMILVGTTLIIVGAVKAIYNSLRELAKSGN